MKAGGFSKPDIHRLLKHYINIATHSGCLKQSRKIPGERRGLLSGHRGNGIVGKPAMGELHRQPQHLWEHPACLSTCGRCSRSRRPGLSPPSLSGKTAEIATMCSVKSHRLLGGRDWHGWGAVIVFTKMASCESQHWQMAAPCWQNKALGAHLQSRVPNGACCSHSC